MPLKGLRDSSHPTLTSNWGVHATPTSPRAAKPSGRLLFRLRWFVANYVKNRRKKNVQLFGWYEVMVFQHFMARKNIKNSTTCVVAGFNFEHLWFFPLQWPIVPKYSFLASILTSHVSRLDVWSIYKLILAIIFIVFIIAYTKNYWRIPHSQIAFCTFGFPKKKWQKSSAHSSRPTTKVWVQSSAPEIPGYHQGHSTWSYGHRHRSSTRSMVDLRLGRCETDVFHQFPRGFMCSSLELVKCK